MQFVLLTLKKQKQRKSLISTQPIYHQPQTVEQAETSGLGILESLLSIETFSKFNNAQVSLFNQLGINDDGVIGKAKAK